MFVWATSRGVVDFGWKWNLQEGRASGTGLETTGLNEVYLVHETAAFGVN